MNTTYQVIRPNGGADTVHHADLPQRPGLDLLKSIVLPYLDGARYMERVNVLHAGHYTDMFVDEDGIMKKLPVNEAATAIYRANWLHQHPKTDPSTLPAIYGPAVLFQRRVWF